MHQSDGTTDTPAACRAAAVMARGAMKKQHTPAASEAGRLTDGRMDTSCCLRGRMWGGGQTSRKRVALLHCTRS